MTGITIHKSQKVNFSLVFFVFSTIFPRFFLEERDFSKNSPFPNPPFHKMVKTTISLPKVTKTILPHRIKGSKEAKAHMTNIRSFIKQIPAQAKISTLSKPSLKKSDKTIMPVKIPPPKQRGPAAPKPISTPIIPPPKE